MSDHDVPWPEIKQLFLEAVAMPPADRARFLSERCAGRPELLREIESLLASESSTPTFVDQPQEALGLAVSEAAKQATLDQAAGHPATIGGCRILSLIGKGGFGFVYLAEQASPRRRVAVKVLRPDVVTPSALRRLELEAEIMARLQHPGIAQVIEAGLEAGPNARPYFVMEYIEGSPISEYVASRRPSVHDRVRLFIDVCDAVQHAHANGVIHRDLKPVNILVTKDGRPKVLDFGVARALDPDARNATLATSVGQVIGTIVYMSPEQARGEPADIGSDAYSLGVVLFELLTGKTPIGIEGRPLVEALRMVCDSAPSRLASLDRSLRGDLELIVAKALEKDPARRYHSAAALADDLRRFLRDEPIEARPPSAVYHLRKMAARNRLGFGAVAVAIVLFVLSSISIAVMALRLRDQRDAATTASTSREQVIRLFTTAISSVGFDPALKGVGGADARISEVLSTLDKEMQSSSVSPDVRFELSRAIGESFGAIGDYRSADRLLTQATELPLPPEQVASAQKALAKVLRTVSIDLERARHLADEAAGRLAPAGKPLTADGASALVEQILVRLEQRQAKDAVELLGDFDRRVGALKGDRGEAPAFLAALRGEVLHTSTTPDYEGAIRQYRTSLEALAGARSDSDPFVRTVRGNLANALYCVGRNDEAVAMYEALVQDASRRYGENNLTVATMMNNLAAAYVMDERWDDAERVSQEAIRIYVAHRGEDDLSVAITRNTLGYALLHKNSNEGTDELLRRAVAVLEGARAGTGEFGPTGWMTLTALSNLGEACQRLQKWEQAEEAYRRQHEGWVKLGATKDQRYRTSLAKWASMRMKQKKWDETTAALARQAYDLFAQHQPGDLDSQAWNLGRALIYSGQFLSAVAFWQSHLSRPDAPAWGNIYLAEALLACGDSSAAETALRQFGDPETSNPGYLGLIYLAADRPDKAAPLLARGLADTPPGMRPFEKARFRVALGQCLLLRGSLEDAKPQILRGLYVLHRDLGDTPFTREAESIRAWLQLSLGEEPVDLIDLGEGRRLEEESLFGRPVPAATRAVEPDRPR
jgi:tetratricopeptide (TPR) repeat protein/predicted Ser/Thr protein kinase